MFYQSPPLFCSFNICGREIHSQFSSQREDKTCPCGQSHLTSDLEPQEKAFLPKDWGIVDTSLQAGGLRGWGWRG